MTKEAFQQLVQKFLQGNATEEEIKMIDRWYYTFDEELTVDLPAVEGEDETTLKERIRQRLLAGLRAEMAQGRPAPLRRLFPRYRAAAAAVLFVLLLGGGYLLLHSGGDGGSKALLEKEPPGQLRLDSGDILPGGDRAILTLANGDRILLDSVPTGQVATEGFTRINLVGKGKLAYEAIAGDLGGVTYNTLATPRGGQYHVVLPDGTSAWLNAASSIRFPTAFPGKERRVEITGEVYLEVARNTRQPFIVQFGETAVTVLGTRFNVNAYAEEARTRTTLLEGSIVIRHQNKEKQLQPGTQAVVEGGELQVRPKINTEEVVAWKNGYFQFSGTDIETLMRQAARWYNIDVQYQGEKPMDRFTGRVSRSVSLSQFLKMLTYSDVRFIQEGKKLIVLP